MRVICRPAWAPCRQAQLHPASRLALLHLLLPCCQGVGCQLQLTSSETPGTLVQGQANWFIKFAPVDDAYGMQR